MDPAATPSAGEQTVSAPQPRKRKGRLLIIVAVACLGLFGILLIPRSPVRDIVLLTQAEARPKPSKFDNFRTKLAMALEPLLRRFRGPRANVLISSKIMVLARNEALQGLGPATVTNSDGSEAWLLGAGQLAAFKSVLATNRETKTVYAPMVQTGDGMEAVMAVRGGFGLDIRMTPELWAGRVRLDFTAKMTGFRGLQVTDQTNIPFMMTNFWVAGHARIPVSGALLLHAVDKTPSATNYLLIISPSAVDATGKALKR